MGILTGNFSSLSEKVKKYFNLMDSGVFSWENLTWHNTEWWEVYDPMPSFWSEQHYPWKWRQLWLLTILLQLLRRRKPRLVSSQSLVFFGLTEIKSNRHEFSFKIPLNNKVAYLKDISDGKLKTWKRVIWSFMLLYFSIL